MATIAPLAFILREVAGNRKTVAVLLPIGASEHTYEPRPSDVEQTEAAQGLFYVSPLLDAWAAKLPCRRVVQVFPFVPVKDRRTAVDDDDDAGTPSHNAPAPTANPHFWTDPVTVKAILPSLVQSLTAADPAGKAEYAANARRFAAQLDRLDGDVARLLAPAKGRRVVLFHPSFDYMLARYGIVVAGAVEPFPGREPTAHYVEKVIYAVRAARAEAIFTEPQLPRRPAEIVAEATGIRMAELDPIGGEPGRDTYESFIRYNAMALRKALP